MKMTEKEIGVHAEEAIRKAEGDWKLARRILSEQIAKDEGLRQDLLDKIMEMELRQAASRLGEATKKCVYCAEIIALDAAKCRYCGEWLDAPAASVPVPPARDASGGPVIRHFTLLTGWALIVLIVILIVAFTRS